jgi:magnesium transporter
MATNKNIEFYTSGDLLEPVLIALEENNLSELKNLIAELHTSDIAELLNLCEKDHRSQILLALGDFDSEILPYLEPGVKDEIIEMLGVKDSAEAVTELEIDDAVQFMEDLTDENREIILDALDKDDREEILESLNYPEDSAGRLANTHYIAVAKNWTVGMAIDHLRATKDLPEDFYAIFVVDENRKPISYVPLSRILRSKREAKIHDLMTDKLRLVSVDTDQEEVAYIFRKYAMASIAVVSENGEIMGVISIDDVADIIQEEAEEDILKLSGGIGGSDFYASPLSTMRNRSPWLIVNLISSILASFVISVFEGSIEQLVALAVLMPIVASMSGNVGSQTLTVAVRAIATKELSFSNAFRVVKKEIFSAQLIGAIFGAILFTLTYILYKNLDLSIIIYVAVLSTFFIASIVGSLTPLILHRMGYDPAIASGPFLFATTDICSFFIFLGLATWIIL